MEFTKKYIRSTAFVLLCIFFFIYAIHHIGNAFKDKTELFLVTRETSENTLDVTGYIFREEFVLYGAGDSCSYNFESGEKISAGSAVAKSFFVESDALRDSIAGIKKRISVLEQSASVLHIDLEEVDAQITALRTRIALLSASGNTAFLDEAQEELLVLLHKRRLAEQNKNNYSAELTTLYAELASLNASAATVSRDIHSSSSGYFYNYTDGLEAYFTANAAKNISFESFDSIVSAVPSKNPAAIGKVAAMGKWYFICKTTVAKAEEIVTDETYSCVLTDNSYTEKLPFTVENKLINYETGDVLLVFSCDQMRTELDFSRIQRARITVSEINGLRVPASSVRVENGQTIVYILKEGVCRQRKINILFEKSGYCIVAEPEGSDFLCVYDRIIIGEKDLFDGHVIDY